MKKESYLIEVGESQIVSEQVPRRVVGLSLPEAMMLKKVMRVRLLGTFFGAVAASIVLLGYVFNVVF